MNELLIIILQSLCANYPILWEWGLTLSVPIALVFSSKSEILQYIRKISANPQIIGMETKVATAREMLEEANSEGVFLMMPGKEAGRSVKFEEKLHMIYSAASTGKVSGSDVCCQTFLVFEKMIPDEYRERVFPIQLDGSVNLGTYLKAWDFVPFGKQLSVVADKISDFPETNPETRTLQAAACFAYPELARRGEKDRFAGFLEEANRIGCSAELYAEADAVTDLAIRLLLEHFNPDGGCELFTLPELTKKEIEKIPTACFAHGDALYMSQGTFKKILTPILSSVSIKMIKNNLYRAGILEGNDGGFTSKMAYISDDEMHLKRMLRLNIEKIELPEENESLKKNIKSLLILNNL